MTMAPVLLARAGDCQAMKVSIAAAVAGYDLDIKLLPDVAAVRSEGCNAFATNTIFFIAQGAVELSRPNVVAAFVGTDKLVPPAHKYEVLDWLEWEARCLRPATFSKHGAKLPDAFKQLQAIKGQYLVGATLTVADISVYCTLLPILLQGGSIPDDVCQYLRRVGDAPAFAAGKAKVLGGQGESCIVEVFQQDCLDHARAQPKLPQPGQRNILITSALPYVNNVPHLGNIIGCVLSADCYARYCRSRGYNCIYVCGTDEYGTATETKAMEEGLTCQQICDKYHAIHRDIYQWFDIGFDRFGRTPTRWQTRICQDMFLALGHNDCLVEQSMEQLYSEALGKFLADRFVCGTCPKCGYEDARGDQCDGCGNLLNPTELINPRCKFSGTTPVQRTTRHFFIDLPKLSPALQDYITRTSQLGGWSSNCVQVTNAWMRDGLKNRCITRDLKWGTPVPKEGYEEKVFYVWFDAPIGYISITACYTPEWEKWWKNPEDVEMVQFMGKDNVPFHTVIFPATLLGSGVNWTMMRNISVTEYLNYEGGKFSKSRGVGVFGNDAKDTGLPVEVWRYYLLSNRPEQSDTDFKWSDLAAKNNNELLATLGNYINRPLMFCAKYFDKKVPGPTSAGADLVAELGKTVSDKLQEYIGAMEKIKLKEGIRLAMSVAMDGNKFLQDNKPWEKVKTDPDLAATLVAAAVGLVRLLAAMIEPYMPSTTSKILQQLNIPPEQVLLNDELLKAASTPHLLLPAGHPINDPFHLFQSIPDATWQALKEKYGGSQAERIDAAATAAAGGKPAAAAAKGGKDAQAKKGGANKGEAKSEDKAAKKSEDKAKKAPPAPMGPLDISGFDIRVGKVLTAAKHPNADSLYVEDVDIGGPEPLKVCSGLAKYYADPQLLVGRSVVALVNLKPAVLRGCPSQAMVLCGATQDGSKMELLEPPADSPLGTRITVEGFSGEPHEQIDPKAKGGLFEAVMPLLATDEQRRACFKGVPFNTPQGPCTVTTIANGLVK